MSQTSAKQWLHSPLAIVGMACRLPGADGVEQFWDLLVRGGYAIERMPDSKLDRALYFDPRKGQRGKTYSEIGGFVSERPLDWSLLNLPQEEAGHWDHCHLTLCEVAARACLDAGYDPRNLPIRKTGVFVGHSGGTTLGGELAYRALLTDFLQLLADMPDWKALGSAALLEQLRDQLCAGRPERDDRRPYIDAGFASGLISRNFGLTGPHMSIDAACASSLVALALGAMSLSSGQTDLAIIGGASYNKADSLVLFSHAQSCSSRMSRPFDQDADGLISAEGYVTILVKQLDKAQADGDRIHAVIRGIGYSSDGRGRSLWAPRHEGQSTAIQRAYPSDIDPASVQMIEAHATSTQVGDATEMEALTGFYAPKLAPGQRLPVGSVKSNIGHTLETAGLAGLIKAVLSMQHGMIPPSINLQNHNETIPWDQIPFFVPQTALPWPELPEGQPRRAAVNTFGIGGLNVHVVVDQAIANSSAQALSSHKKIPAAVAISKSARSAEPIALVGRGLVVPGAKNLADYEQLIKRNLGLPSHGPLCHKVAFEYDWRKHKVPPKQVAHANPLQFMLLEAAEQAINEASLLNERFDRSSAAVVVGSIFGGDFGNSLFAGLRLPEFRDRLLRVLAANGVADADAQQLADRYEQEFLKHYPALLDETGSFTSSTLASRIAKTFNLMGGAMAIDAGGVSGLAALNTACWLLQSGTVSSVLCAAAQRALDRAAIDNLRQIGHLRSDQLPDSGYAVGEGVALVVLKRLSDARRDGNKILATIESVGLGFDATNLAASVRHATISAGTEWNNSKVVGRLGIDRLDEQVERALSGPAASPPAPTTVSPFGQSSTATITKPRNLDVTGHLQGAQGLVDLIDCSLDKSQASHVIVGHTLSGQSAVVQLAIPDAIAIPKIVEPNTVELHTSQINSQANNQPVSNTIPVAITTSSGVSETWKKIGLEIRYWSAETIEQLKSAPQNPDWNPSDYVPQGRFVAVVVAPVGDCRNKAKKLSVMIGQSLPLDNLIDQGVWWVDRNALATSSPRIALAFSGQGSQYTGMLRSLVEQFPDAAQLMHSADTVLSKLDGSTFANMAWAGDNQLGENVWHTQAALLVADSMLARVVQSFGIQPEVVFGHSYGEIPAMLVAGSLDLRTAIQLTWARCQCVAKHSPNGCSMLSVQADSKVVANLIAEYHLPLAISHINAPLQTVVGGKHVQIAQMAAVLEECGIASRILPVPTAFHTPALQPAVEPFRNSLQTLAIQPPQIPLLSSVNCRFIADPELIRDGLAEQLVTPLNFVALMERLAGQGLTHVIEVGPQRVLTRLARASATGMQIFASDYGPQGDRSAMALMPLALLSAFARLTKNTRTNLLPNSSRVTSSFSADFDDSSSSRTGVKHFDATATRRQRLRNRSSQSRHLAPVVPVQQAAMAEANPMLAADSHSTSMTPRTPTLSAASVIHSPAVAPVVALASPPATSVEPNQEMPLSSEVEQILIDFVVEQTGYPAEIVELDVDLEADLGIDSIKKAQLLGELRELFPQALASMQSSKGTSGNDARAQGNRLSELRTLRDFVKLLNTSAAQPSPVPQLDSNSAPIQAAPIHVAPTLLAPIQAAPIQETPKPNIHVPVAAETVSAISRKSLEQFVVDFVVEQTGYPTEIVELDANLEADLGIDSIKKAQLLGELRETFSLKLSSSSDSAASNLSKPKSGLDQLRTLNQILDLLTQQLGSSVVDTTIDTVESTVVPESIELPKEAPQTTAPSYDQVTESLSKELSSPSNFVTVHAAIRSSHSLPVLNSADSPNGFADAVRLNLRALPTRRNVDSSTNSFRLESLPRSVRSLAEHAEVAPEALWAFDQQLIQHSNWKLIPPASGNGNRDSIFYFLELYLPSWLSNGKFQPVGVKVDSDLQGIELLTPGATTPLVLINDRSQLIAAGSTTATGRVWLAEQLPLLAACDSASLLTAVRAWDAPCDWWLVVVDPSRSMLEELQSRNQVFSHAQSRIDRWSNCDRLSHDVWAKLGFDTTLQSWVVLSRAGDLHQPTRSLIPNHTSIATNHVTASDSRLVETADATTLDAYVAEYDFFAEFSSVDLSQCNETEGPRSNDRDGAALQSLDSSMQLESLQNTKAQSNVAQRYILRMAPAPQIEVPGRQPTWNGGAIVVGNNPIAEQLVSRLRSCGVDVIRLSAGGNSDVRTLSQTFVELSQSRRLPHLFITSACDQEAKFSLESADWQIRRNAGLMSVFWLCQKWVEHITNLNMADDASLIAVSSLGGDFGISGNVFSAEGGGINGLLKSILIESWMQGFRSLPIKTIDTSVQQSPTEVVDCIWRELAVPSYDNEISYRDGVRQILKAIPRSAIGSESTAQTDAARQSATVSQLRPLTHGGTWVCTGGARGITALVSERLATRYGLTLHLLGTSPGPNFDLSWRDLDAEGLRQLKLQVMTAARKIGVNPVKHWQNTEKQLEIDATLERLRSLGIKAYYHCCDVSDRQQLAEVLSLVRRESGAIHGVLHGAGVGRDSRFDRKQPEKVEQCIGAKVDGALALMEATWNDPLEAFLGFGSISGRFGANGHTDYSLANEMLCKEIDWLKAQRPDVRAIGFHWHAWGDVGMATKPETKLALEMIHMQFMPAEEGIQHLIAELEGNANESEVLITDDRYYRAFYPAETLVETQGDDGHSIATPLLTECAPDTGKNATSNQRTWRARLHPIKDPFLAEHLLDGKPLLPFVVASEMLYEAAAATLGSSKITLRDIQAHGAIRFFTEAEQELSILSTVSASTDLRQTSVELRSDFVSRKGVIVDRQRLNFSALAQCLMQQSTEGSTHFSLSDRIDWQQVHYPAPDAEFYAGWPLQKLRKVALLDGGLVGKIGAPALIELAGVTRSTQGWAIPSAALDACLFAVGILAWQRIAPGSALPVRMGQLQLGRLPKPGEACMIHAVLKDSAETNASFDFSLYGVDGSLILDVVDYEVAWLARSQTDASYSAQPEQR